jgi:hypothetical protein
MLNRIFICDWYVLMWGSKSKCHKDTCLKEIGLCLQILITSLQFLVSTSGSIYVPNSEINKHVSLITITKVGNVQFIIWFFHIFHRRFANATQGLLCEPNWYNLENMKKESNDTHIPYFVITCQGYMSYSLSWPTINLTNVKGSLVRTCPP